LCVLFFDKEAVSSYVRLATLQNKLLHNFVENCDTLHPQWFCAFMYKTKINYFTRCKLCSWN